MSLRLCVPSSENLYLKGDGSTTAIIIDLDRLPEGFFHTPHYGSLSDAPSVTCSDSTPVVATLITGNRLLLTFSTPISGEPYLTFGSLHFEV